MHIMAQEGYNKMTESRRLQGDVLTQAEKMRLKCWWTDVFERGVFVKDFAAYFNLNSITCVVNRELEN